MEGALCNVGGKMYMTSQGITSNIKNHLKVKHSKVPSVQSMLHTQNKKNRELAC